MPADPPLHAAALAAGLNARDAHLLHNSNPNPLPTRAVRLADGDTLISDQFNDQVIEINPKGQIVFTQGQINTDGSGFNQLNAPYDAKVIGDFTGLTNPGLFPLP